MDTIQIENESYALYIKVCHANRPINVFIFKEVKEVYYKEEIKASMFEIKKKLKHESKKKSKM